MRTLIQDLRYGLRTLAKSPGFAVVAVLTLALGIGANTATFSLVDAVILRPLPYKDPEHLVLVKERLARVSAQTVNVSAPDVLQFQRQNQVFAGLAGFQGLHFDLSGESEPQRIEASRVNADLFAVLGVKPIVGRTFTADEDQPGRLVAILSYGLWQNRFGANPNILDQPVTLDRKPYTVVGVMPRSFVFPLPGMQAGNAADLWALEAQTQPHTYQPFLQTEPDFADFVGSLNVAVRATGGSGRRYCHSPRCRGVT